MIQGKIKTRLTIENVLSRISEYDIYKMFMTHKFTPNRVTRSPFRKDDNPSFVIGNKNGKYIHIDYGDGRYRGGCFDFVMQKEGLDLYNCLKLVDKTFSLGLEGGDVKYKEIVEKYEQPEIDEIETPKHIEATHKAFTKEGHAYWNAYHLSEDYLKKYDVYQVKQLFIARSRFPLPTNEPVFVFRTPEGKMKIYRPTISRSVKKESRTYLWRFRTSIPNTYMFGKENMKCKKGLVLKSKKDEMVISLIYPCVSSIQSESIACFSEENVKFLNDNCEQVYIGMGSDKQGKEQSQLITGTFGYKHINTPDNYLPDNDFAEVAKRHGLKVLEDHFKNKGIL